jgi:hypothetical protein
MEGPKVLVYMHDMYMSGDLLVPTWRGNGGSGNYLEKEGMEGLEVWRSGGGGQGEAETRTRGKGT